MKYNLKPVPGVVQEKRKINISGMNIPILILRPEKQKRMYQVYFGCMAVVVFLE